MTSKSRRRRIAAILRYAALTAWAVVAFFPIFWMISTSFKPDTQWFAWPPFYFPHPPTLSNYLNVWFGAEEYAATQYAISSQKPLISLMNSTIIAGTSTLLSVLFGSVLAYGVSRYRILSETRMFQLLMLRMIPPIVIVAPLSLYYSALGLLDSMTGLILIYFLTTLPYAVWMTKSFIDEVPREIEQAAEILGASRWRTIFEIVLPLIRSGLVATFLFILILTWSEYLLALIITKTQVTTLPIELSKYQGTDRRPRLRTPGGALGRHHHSADHRRPDHPQASRARLQLRHGTEIAVARIELVGLRKTFGSVVAVRDISLTIEDGEFVVLVGPSGCGKTTTLRMIAGFEDASAGEIRIDGRVVNDLEPRDRGLGMVFQTHALFPHKTVAQNIEFGLRMKRMPEPERTQRVREVADMVHISHLLDKMPGQCSGGEAQRVALARTLVTNPSTFLLDEPLSSLDAKLRRELRAECDRLHQALKRTFIFVTHDQEEAMTLADRIVVMRSGEIVQIGSPMEIYSDPVNYFVADFFGSPSMNLLGGEIVQANGAARFRAASFEVALPERFKATEPGTATLGIRPEHVAASMGGNGDVELPVRLVEPLGADTLLYFDVGTERAFVAVSEGLDMADAGVGARVALSLDPRRLYLFGADGRRLAPP